MKHFWFALMVVAMTVMGCGSAPPDISVNIGPMTLLEGDVRGTLHGQVVQGPATLLRGGVEDGSTFVEVVRENSPKETDGKVAMVRLNFPDLATLKATNALTLPAESPSGALGCSGPAVDRWVKDTGARYGTIFAVPTGEGRSRLQFNLDFGEEGRLVGFVDVADNT